MKKGELRTEEGSTAKKNREYIVTDTCFWEEEAPEGYNPNDKTRSPHYVHLVDKENGTVVALPSGSIIKIVKLKK